MLSLLHSLCFVAGAMVFVPLSIYWHRLSSLYAPDMGKTNTPHQITLFSEFAKMIFGDVVFLSVCTSIVVTRGCR